MPDESANETRAIGLVGMAFAYGLIAKLTAKGLLTKDEMSEVFEGVLSTLESTQAPNDPAIPVARVLVDAMAQIAATNLRVPPQSTPSP